METFKEKLENVINHTFDILRNNSSESRIIFPNYNNLNHRRRVSEQELRFVFVEQLQKLLEEYDMFYSVETPTHDRYKFTENRNNVVPKTDNNGQSANFDLTIVDKKGKMIAIIEFKAKMSSKHEYAKDLCKLWNPKEKGSYKYFINLFEKIDKSTEESFKEKFNPDANKWLLNLKKDSNDEVIVIGQSLRQEDIFIRERY